jgi:hypothetical protein
MESPIRVEIGSAWDFRFHRNGVAIVQLSGIATDDSTWGQWYVGSLGPSLEPFDSTLFANDVTVNAAR